MRQSGVARTALREVGRSPGPSEHRPSRRPAVVGTRDSAMMDVSGPRRSVIVLERDSMLLDGLTAALAGNYAVRAVTGIEHVRNLATDDIAVMILGPTQGDAVTMEQVGQLTKAHPGLGVLLVVDETSTSALRLALRAGISDAVDLRSVEEELVDAVGGLWSRLERKQELASAGTHGPLPLARVTTVFSPKGGVGKSVVAVNLAVAFARKSKSPRPVAILDLDLQFGDVAVMLRLQPVHTILEAAAAGDQLDQVLLSSLLVRHDASNVLVLAAPTTPTDSEQIDAKDMLRILGILREMCSHVVIDTPPHLSELVLQAVAQSNSVAFVVGMDVPAVKNARLGLQAFELLRLPLDNVVLVLNRADSKVRLTAAEIERSLGMKVAVKLPSEALVPQSVNEGVPALIASPRSRFAGQIEALAEMLMPGAEATHGS